MEINNYLGRTYVKARGTGETARVWVGKESYKGEWEEVEEKGWKPDECDGN